MIGWREDLGWRITCRENLPPPIEMITWQHEKLQSLRLPNDLH